MQPKSPWKYIAPKMLEIDHWTVLHIYIYICAIYIYIYIYLCSFLLGPRVQKRCHVNLFFKRLGSSFFLPSKTSACGSQIASAMTSSSGTWRPRLVSQTYHNLGYHGHVLTNTAGLSDGLVHVNLVSSRMMFQWLGFNDSGTCDMWAYPSTTNHEGIGTSKGSS